MGRKAALLGWAQANGLPTPGGFVLPAERFWAALDASNGREQARYLEQAALRLDPRHTVAIAASIRESMSAAVVDELARADAEDAFPVLGPGPVVCRSSSPMEDGRVAAFPGVFVSVLDIGSAAALAGAIAACWRSVFSTNAIRYLLRVRAEPVDFSLAVVLQRQVDAAWYGVYFSVDPVTGAAEPLADLSDAGPEALVSGARATLRTRRRDGRWTGTDDARSLEAVHRASLRLARHVQAEVDVEFAVPHRGGEPVILQCRPLTGRTPERPIAGDPAIAESRAWGRPCAAGRVVGPATDGAQPGIAVVEQLTTADYGVVLASPGVVMEQDASPLSHVAILCRELGVPFVCGVEGARARLIGRRVYVDGGTGEVRVLGEEEDVKGPASPRPRAEAAISGVELVLRLLAEGRPGHEPVAEAERIARRYARALGSDSVRVVQPSPSAAEAERLQQFGAATFGPDFSIAALLAHWETRRATRNG